MTSCLFYDLLHFMYMSLACMSFCMCACYVLTEVIGRYQSSKTGIADGYEPPCVLCKNKCSLLQALYPVSHPAFFFF